MPAGRDMARWSTTTRGPVAWPRSTCWTWAIATSRSSAAIPTATPLPPVSEGSFDFRLKLATVDFRGDAWGGLRLTGDAGDGIQFIGRRTGGYWTVEWGVMTGAGFVDQDFRPVAAGNEGLWLQLRRDGEVGARAPDQGGFSMPSFIQKLRS